MKSLKPLKTLNGEAGEFSRSDAEAQRWGGKKNTNKEFSHGATELTEVKEKIGCAFSPFREK